MISCGALANKTALTIRPCLSSSEAEGYQMAFKMTGFFTEDRGRVRRRIPGIYCLLLLFNAGSWFWAVMVFSWTFPPAGNGFPRVQPGAATCGGRGSYRGNRERHSQNDARRQAPRRSRIHVLARPCNDRVRR